MNIYLAGPIFTERDRSFNAYLEKEILKVHPEVNLYLAQNNTSINDKTGCANSADIYVGDVRRLKQSDLVITIMSGDLPPIGSSYECAYYAGLCENDLTKKIIALYDDNREGNHTYSEDKVDAMISGNAENQWPYINLLAIGFVKKCGEIYFDSDSFLRAINRQIELFEDERTCGIYKITNLKNNLCYIGQTRNFSGRWSHHKADAGKPRLRNMPLYDDMNKLGLEYFKFEILEKCDLKDLDTREKYWIDFFDAYNLGYNGTTGGSNQKHNIETQQTVKVYAYNPDGSFYQEFISIASAMRACNLKTNNITRCIKYNDNKHLTGGYMWRLFKTDRIQPYEAPIQGKTIYAYDATTGVFVKEYSNLHEAGVALTGEHQPHIYECAHGKRNSCCGFKWAYDYFDRLPINYYDQIKNFTGNAISVSCYNAKTDEYIQSFDSISQAAKFYHLDDRHIGDCIKNLRRTTGGMKWSTVKVNNFKEIK